MSDNRSWATRPGVPPAARRGRVRDTKPDFGLTAENAAAVVAICRRLDGLPLALELAAARIRIFSPQGLLGRLQHSLQLLSGSDKDRAARQQTLRAAIAWSHDLLSEPEQALFQMAIFAGGCTLEAIEAVFNAPDGVPPAVVERVQSLVGKSLLQQREGLAQEPRFWMLETIREYAREQLAASDESEELRRRHALFLVNLVEQAEPRLWRAETMAEFRELEHEQENLRGVLEWALGARGAAPRMKAELGLRLCAALHLFWHFERSFSEGRHWLEAALQHDFSADAMERTAAEQAVLDRAGARALRGGAFCDGTGRVYDGHGPHLGGPEYQSPIGVPVGHPRRAFRHRESGRASRRLCDDTNHV